MTALVLSAAMLCVARVEGSRGLLRRPPAQPGSYHASPETLPAVPDPRVREHPLVSANTPFHETCPVSEVTVVGLRGAEETPP